VATGRVICILICILIFILIFILICSACSAHQHTGKHRPPTPAPITVAVGRVEAITTATRSPNAPPRNDHYR